MTWWRHRPTFCSPGSRLVSHPRWHDDRLWIADWGPQDIIAIDRDGNAENTVQLQFGSFQAICCDWLRDGRLTLKQRQAPNASGSSRSCLAPLGLSYSGRWFEKHAVARHSRVGALTTVEAAGRPLS